MWRRLIPWKMLGLALPRGLALFLGLFSLLNIAGELRAPGFDANLWWINLPGDWRLIESGLLIWSAGCLLWLATRQTYTRTAKIVLTITVGLLLLASVWNAINFSWLLAAGSIHSRFPMPLSALVTVALSIILGGLYRPVPDVGVRPSKVYYLSLAATSVACGLLFPVAQMICFGTTDYRRPADVIVVFGAKVHASGQLSSILEERVRTGCELYHAGLARHILFSGGPGVGAIHETEGMRRRAIELGVPSEAISVDLDGLDTDSTAINTLRMARERGWRRFLAVSQFFHLPRIKLAFHRHGAEVYTVPAVRLYHFRYLPYFMLREVAAWWLYYVRPLW